MSKTPEKNDENLPRLGRALLFLDKKRSVEMIVYGLYVVCALLFLADFFYDKKTYVDAEDIPGFYALYGFFMCAALVICARMMRVVLMRPETYYAPNDVEAEEYPEDQLSKESVND
jgi:amino acid transporter